MSIMGDISGFLAENEPGRDAVAPAPAPAPAAGERPVLADDPAASGEPFGWELTIDLVGCDLATIKSWWKVWRFPRKLCKVIDMKPYRWAHAPRFALHNPNAAGRSFFQFITTSSITGHLVESKRTAYVNLFSCKPFDADQAIACITSYFGGTVANVKVHRRG
jgi:hypothetical protein